MRPNSEMAAPEVELRETVEEATPILLGIDASLAGRRPAPDAWCAKEILGHLVDSASNNHQRFVRVEVSDELVFPGYDQEAWVARQRYADAGWTELVALWRSYNLHLARVIEAIPPAARRVARRRHNLDEIAWQVVAKSEPVTLEYFLADYVGHLKHHLRQLLRACGREPAGRIADGAPA
jgi:hypothetical protein